MPRRLARDDVIDSWRPYVRHVADRMRLRDWQVELLAEGPDDPDYAADVTCLPGRKIAYVRLGNEFLDHYAAEQQRQTVVHELVHLHLDQAQRVAEEAMGDHWHTFRLLLEYGVDALADALAPSMPLPEIAEPTPHPEETPVAKKSKKPRGKTGGPMSPGTSPKPKALDKPARGNQPLAGKKGGKMKGGDCC